MNDDSSPQTLSLREQAMRSLKEDEEIAAQQAAINCCDKCQEPKSEVKYCIKFANGILLDSCSQHCGKQRADCTARVHTYLLDVPPTVGNRIINWLIEQPQLKAVGVSWMACFAIGADHLLLIYRVPYSQLVEAAVAAVQVEEFLQEPVGPPCVKCGEFIPLARMCSVPNAVRCLVCQIEYERMMMNSVSFEFTDGAILFCIPEHGCGLNYLLERYVCSERIAVPNYETMAGCLGRAARAGFITIPTDDQYLLTSRWIDRVNKLVKEFVPSELAMIEFAEELEAQQWPAVGSEYVLPMADYQRAADHTQRFLDELFARYK